MSEEKTNLLPCPFCGFRIVELTTAVGESWVHCRMCNGSSGMKSAPLAAVNAWNRREQTECPVCTFAEDLKKQMDS